MAIGNGHKIKQVDIASIINTIYSVFFDCAAISYIFSEWHLFFSYHSLTNNEYIIINKHYYISIAGIRSVTLMMVLPNGISKLTFTDALHIPMLEANLISLSVLYHKGALVQS